MVHGARIRQMARIYIERQDLPDDVRRLFDALCDPVDPARPIAPECSPPVDVLETDLGIEILVDLPGVESAGLQVVFTRNVLLIAGEKLPFAVEQAEAEFHLAERAFGRFARAVRLDGAFDGANVTASMHAGELRVVIPRIDERRGREIRIPVRA